MRNTPIGKERPPRYLKKFILSMVLDKKYFMLDNYVFNKLGQVRDYLNDTISNAWI